MLLRATISLAALPILVAACGRPSQEVTVQRSSDEVLSCFQLNSEYQANLDSIGFNRDESLARERDNLGSIAGVLVGGVGALAAVDMGSAEEAELRAFIARNRRIAELSEAKQCPPLEPDMDSIVSELEAAEAAREAAPTTRPEEQ